MPTIRKRNGKFQAQARRTGYKPQSKSFDTKAEAVRWAKAAEASLLPIQTDGRIDPITLGSLLRSYLKEVSPGRPSGWHDKICVQNICSFQFSNMPIESLTVDNLLEYRQERLKTVKTSTVGWDESFLGLVLRWGRHKDLTKDLPKLKLPPGRSRRLEASELQALLSIPSRTPQIRTLILLAIETGMRKGELIKLRWEDINVGKRLVHIPHTKTGFPRDIPLTSYAAHLLQEQPKTREKVFRITLGQATQAWERIRNKAARTNTSLHTLTFHDLRHEAISRFFEMGLNVPEVALISGHRSPSNLFRYTHVRPEHVAKKLRQVENARTA